jgi:predicted ArsR family transcriptional regulator
MMHRLDSIGDRDLRETLLFARAQPAPVTADDVASAQRIHRNVARGRLERLAEAGLLIASFERRTGRTGPGAGRPAKTYRVAPELTAIEFPERRYERLIALVVDALPERARRDRLREIGIAFGRELAREARLRSAKTCPLRPLVRAQPALATLDRGMWAALVARALEGASLDQITCDTPSCQRDDADCRVLLTLQARRS